MAAWRHIRLRDFAHLLRGVLHWLLISAFEKRQQADYLADTGLDKEEVEGLLTEAALSFRPRNSGSPNALNGVYLLGPVS